MASVLWRGSWTDRLRIGSGLVLLAFVSLHFLNIGLGMVSPEAMDAMQAARQVFSRSLPGTVLLYGALLVHTALALVKLASRRTLKLPLWSLAQIALGLAVPLLLIVHVIYTRAAHELFGVNDRMGYLIGLIWNTSSGRNQAILLLLVWGHACIGLHFWLRLKPWWRKASPYAIAVAVLVPAFALAGFVTEGRRIHALFADPEARAALKALYNWPDGAAFGELARITTQANTVFWLLLGSAIAIHVARRILARRGRKLRIRYVDGPEVGAAPGPTLLEMSQANGVPHMSMCGGRGRCTTCRVIVEDGADSLPAPSEAEARSLAAVNATPGTRLACQVRPSTSLTVFRVFDPGGGKRRNHPRQGQERRLAVLFLDMRGFTARTAGQLPYDVVFLLNRFFDAIVPPITRAGGSVDKYLGDGLLAVFETADTASSARAALKAAAGIGAALADFNAKLAAEGSKPLRIGVGLHLGTLVLGEIGAAGHAPRTIIGDTVNVASRLEAATKDLGVEALISEALLRAAGADVATLDLVTLELRGVDAPVVAAPVHSWPDLDALIPQDTAKAAG